MKVILVSQGRTKWDDESRLQGTIDVPLSVRGRKEVGGLARRLKDLRPKRILSGNGQTLVETCRILSRTLGCRVTRCDELDDLDHGLWQGMLLDELEGRYPKAFRRWRRNPTRVAPPRGEAVTEMLKRVSRVIDQFRRRPGRGTVVMVLPEVVRMAAEALLSGVRLETIWSNGSPLSEWTGIEV